MPRRGGSRAPPSSEEAPPETLLSSAMPCRGGPRAPPSSAAASVPPTSKEAPPETLLRAPTSPRPDAVRRNPPRGASGSVAPQSSSSEALPLTSKEAPPPTSKTTLLRAPTSPRRRNPPRGASAAPQPSSEEALPRPDPVLRRNPPLGASGKNSEAHADDRQQPKSPPAMPATVPLEVALSAAVQPKIRFVTRYGETRQPASATPMPNPQLGSSTMTSAAADLDDKRQLRIQSLTFKGIRGSGRAGSDAKELAIIYDEEMTLHKPPDYFNAKEVEEEKEKPERLTCIMDKIIEEKLQNRFDLFKPDEAPTNSLVAVHGIEHVKAIESLWSKNDEERKALSNAADDVYYCQGSSRAAFLAAGGAIKACTLVVEGTYRHSFAVIRPPGHHAGKKGPSGFCLLNNVAVAAKHLLNKYEKKKIVIVDLDIHHGNGTQEIFYDENTVLFISIHRYSDDMSIYPPTTDGHLNNVGNGPGKGFNVNCCLLHRYAGDADYFAILEDIVIPLIENYGPEIILISAGFDAAAGDTVGDCKVTPNGYATIVEMLMRLGSLVLILEGGYKLDILAECASACIKVLSGDKSCVIFERTARPSRSTVQMIKKTKQKLSEVWDIFKEDQKKAAVVARKQ